MDNILTNAAEFYPGSRAVNGGEIVTVEANRGGMILVRGRHGLRLVPERACVPLSANVSVPDFQGWLTDAGL